MTDQAWWEDVEPEIEQAVLDRMDLYVEAGIGSVDLPLAAHGTALQVFSTRCPYRVAAIPRRAGGDAGPADACSLARAVVDRWIKAREPLVVTPETVIEPGPAAIAAGHGSKQRELL